MGYMILEIVIVLIIALGVGATLGWIAATRHHLGDAQPAARAGHGAGHGDAHGAGHGAAAHGPAHGGGHGAHRVGDPDRALQAALAEARARLAALSEERDLLADRLARASAGSAAVATGVTPTASVETPAPLVAAPAIGQPQALSTAAATAPVPAAAAAADPAIFPTGPQPETQTGPQSGPGAPEARPTPEPDPAPAAAADPATEGEDLDTATIVVADPATEGDAVQATATAAVPAREGEDPDTATPEIVTAPDPAAGSPQAADPAAPRRDDSQTPPAVLDSDSPEIAARAARVTTGTRPAADTDGATPPDDLKVIRGIGPVIETQLHALGIRRLQQIAALSEAEIAWVDTFLAFRGRINREDWVGQARARLNGDEDGDAAAASGVTPGGTA